MIRAHGKECFCVKCEHKRVKSERKKHRLKRRTKK